MGVGGEDKRRGKQKGESGEGTHNGVKGKREEKQGGDQVGVRGGDLVGVRGETGVRGTWENSMRVETGVVFLALLTLTHYTPA